MRRKSYRIVSLGAPPNLKYLHSKTGRRVDLARVRYGTMQSERRRLRFTTGILRNQNLEVVYATIVDLADLSTRVVSFGSMLKRAKSLMHLKTAQKPEKRLRNTLARELGRNPRQYKLESS